MQTVTPFDCEIFTIVQSTGVIQTKNKSSQFLGSDVSTNKVSYRP